MSIKNLPRAEYMCYRGRRKVLMSLCDLAFSDGFEIRQQELQFLVEELPKEVKNTLERKIPGIIANEITCVILSKICAFHRMHQ